MAHTMCIAAFVIASAVAQAKPSSSVHGCPSDNMPNGDVSLLQKEFQVNVHTDVSQENTVGQHWSPEVHEYIQYLESLEGSPVLARVVEDEDSSAIGGETLFIAVSDSDHYSENLRWISGSWGKDVPSSHLLAIGDGANIGENATKMRVQETRCPAHTIDGACCKGAEAIITAHQELMKQPSLKWAFILEDDSYVRAESIDKRLQLEDPVGKASRGTLIALESCTSGGKCPNGVCGGGGIAVSREALTTLVGNSPSKYLIGHMQACDLCGMNRGDEAIGTQAHAHNINVISEGPTVKGMTFLGLPNNEDTFYDSFTTGVEPLVYHPLKKAGQFKFLDQLFAKQQESTKDASGKYCATYNGPGSGCMAENDFGFNFSWGDCATGGYTVCTSNRDDVPWKW